MKHRNYRKMLIFLLIILLGMNGLLSFGKEQDDLDELKPKIWQLYQEKKYREAVPLAERAVELAKKMFGADHQEFANMLGVLSTLYLYIGDYSKAELLCKRVLKIREKVLGKDHLDVANALNNLWLVYLAEGRYAEAESLYKRAQKIFQKALGPDHPDVVAYSGGLAAYLRILAELHAKKGDPQKVIQYYEQALKIYEHTKDRTNQAEILFKIGVSYSVLRDYSKSLIYFKEAEKISRDIARNLPGRDSEERLVRILSGIGLIHACQAWKAYQNGDLQKAIDLALMGLKFFQETKNALFEAASLAFIGNAYSYMGRHLRAIEYYQQLLSFFKTVGNKVRQGNVLENIGQAYFYSGDYPEAITTYQKVLEIREEAGDKLGYGITLNQMGDTYALSADYDKGMEKYQKALQFSKKTGEKYVEAFALCGIGFINFLSGNYPESLTAFQAAEKLARKADIKDAQAFSCWGEGEVYSAMGQHTEALKFYKETLKVSRDIRYELFEAGAQLGIGKEYSLSGDYTRSDQSLEESIRILIKIGFQGYVWVCRHEMGRNFERQGKIQEAINNYKSAIENIESIRGKLKTGLQRALFVKNKMSVYEDLIRLLIKVGDKDGALEYTERAKGRAFLDMLGNKTNSVMKDVAPSLLEKESVLRGEINTIQLGIKKKRTLMEEDNFDYPGKTIVSRGELFNTASPEKITESLKTRGSSLIKEYDQTIKKIQEQSPEIASLLSVIPLKSNEIKGLIGEDTAILEYFIGVDHSFLFFITESEIISRSIKISPDEIKRLVLDFREKSAESINAAKLSRDDYKGPLAKLYDYLIQPIKSKIESEKRLIIVPHGILHYLPFQALINKQNAKDSYLVEDFQISYSPSSSVLKYAKDKNEQRKKNLLSFGNPNTDLEKLPSAEEECKNISSLYQSPRLYLGRDATEKRAKRESSGYDILHFATHGVLDRFNPLQSNLRLTGEDEEDGRLTVDEIFDMGLSAYLVTLSACETGIGLGYQGLSKGEARRKDIDFPPGDEVVGLGRGFIYAGTPSVVASLWKVSDESTAELMEDFYKNLKTMDKAEALRQAQLKLMGSGRERGRQRGVGGIGKAKSSGKAIDTSHPYFWAPFILIGDWK